MRIKQSSVCKNCGRRIWNEFGIWVCWVCAFPSLRKMDAECRAPKEHKHGS